MSADLVFYGFALLTVVSGFMVATRRNIVHAGFSLLFTLLGVAGLFATLGADFLAVTQTIVYIGGILILVLFAVMMTRMPERAGDGRGFGRAVPAAAFSIGILALLVGVITGAGWRLAETGPAQPTIKSIGVELLTNYIFPFEFASLVLLVAMIGAAIMIRQRDEDADAEGEESS